MNPLALSLYHQSLKTYGLLQKLFRLPSTSTLKCIMRRVNIQPGFSESILKALANKAKSMKTEERLCLIAFDEMTIRESLTFDVARDRVEGLQDLGPSLGRSRFVANHAGVFMVRGLFSKWKQSIGYFLSSGPVKNSSLKELICETVKLVKAAGLDPKVFVCDQGANNRSVLQCLGVTETSPHFTVEMPNESVTMHAMYDPPHPIKNVRYHFKQSGFMVNGKKISWQYIEKFYDEDCKLPIRMAPKLTKKHIIIPPFKGMSVKLATQIFSHSVAAGISTLCSLGHMKADAIHTARFVENFDKLFNCFNSMNVHDSNEFRCALSASSCHWDFLDDCLNWLNGIEKCQKHK